MTSHCMIDRMPAEVLLNIFAHLKQRDLCRLKQTCRRLNSFINTWDHFLIRETPLVTNQQSDIFLSRCMRQLLALEQIRISRNWMNGRYCERSLLFKRNEVVHPDDECLPRLHLNDEYLWMSRGTFVYCYKRINVDNEDEPCTVLQTHDKKEILDLRIKSGYLLCGLRGGGIYLRNIDARYTICDMDECHRRSVYSVDLTNDGKHIVASSLDRCLKIFTVNEDETLEETYQTFLDNSKIWKVSLSDDQSLLAVGGHERNCASIYDFPSMTKIYTLCCTDVYNRNVFELKWDGMHTIWTCGLKGGVGHWDLRTGNREQYFVDPKKIGYCSMDYDYINSIMTGSRIDGMVTLWDIRQPKYTQFYFMRSSTSSSTVTKNSSVDSLAFDAEYLFMATNNHLNILDFSIYNGEAYDHSYLSIY